MTYYKLIDAVRVPLVLNVATNVRGGIRYGSMRLEPNTVYEMPRNNPALDKSLRNYKARKRYTPELEDSLKQVGAKYEVILCKSCGGRVKKIEYNPVEVFDEEEG